MVFTYEDITGNESVLPEVSGMGGIKRKVNEIYYATHINSKQILDKKVIFQKYINIINFGAGNNMLGVQKASKYYFDKDVSELSLVESAFLAGVINAPNRYTPYYKLSLAKERTNTVLEMMNFHGYITDEEYQRALTIPLENLFVRQQLNSSDALPYQSYIDIVLDEVEELTGLSPVNTSMVIHTAMNPKLQAELDRGQNREIDYLNIQTQHDTDMQAAATVIENATGEVIASFGGYDYFGQRIVNRSYHSLYQPGSTVKPIIAYAPAFEYLGYATSHVILDEPYTWAGTNTHLTNWSGGYYGQVRLLEAVAQSYNIPAVKTYDEVNEKIGSDRYKDYVEAVGFKRYAQKLDEWYEAIGSDYQGRDALNAQFSIGGSDFYTNTQELAGSTAMLMNGGDFIKPHTIREVEIVATGEVIKSPHKQTPVLSEAAAYLTAYAMKNVIDSNPYGPVERYVSRSYPVYAKTGTTVWDTSVASDFNVPAESPKDRLLLTATDRFSIATWSGFDPDSINRKDGTAYQTDALRSFQIQARLSSFILDELEDQFGPGRAIAQPSTVRQISHILGTFPYQSPIDGMNQDLVTSGYIKADYATLVPATPPELEEFKGAQVTSTNSGSTLNIAVSFTDYPDKEQLIKAEEIIKFENGRTGKRLYDPSWIFGPVRYTTEVYIDNALHDTVKTEDNKQSISINISKASSVEVCTFYSFELNDTQTSNKECHDVNLDDLTVTLPDFTRKSLSEVESFAAQYNITVNHTFGSTSNDITDFSSVESISGKPNSQNVKVSALRNATWNVRLYDYSLRKNTYTQSTGSNMKTLLERYGVYVEIVSDNPNNKIKELVDMNNSAVINGTNLSNYYYSNGIYIYTED